MADKKFDVAVIGAGPAGSAAALLLARAGRRVVVVDRFAFPRPAICSGWVGARIEPLLEELGVKSKSLLSVGLSDITFYNGDLSKSARPVFPSSPGFVVQRDVFDQALIEAAVKNGAEFLSGKNVSDIRLNESSVGLVLSRGQEVVSRLLVMASGRGSPLMDRLGFPREPGETPIWCAQASVEEGDAALGAGKSRVAVILGLDGGNSFGLCCVTGKRTTVDINWFGEKFVAGRGLVKICQLAHQHGVVSKDLSKAAEKAPVVRSPAAAALDVDSHVRKHTLVIGEAGGFVSAVSNEGILPSLWSAKIAAEVVQEALDSRHSQDSLMAFDSAWRLQIADHLRSPHTDIRFLLPLIFSNQPMADRMGAAFFSGENI